MAKKPLSRLQLRANRENAKLSTGPKTPEGKARCAENLVKALAKRQELMVNVFVSDNARFPNEDDAIRLYLKSAFLQHKPANDLEYCIVLQIVRNHLQMIRYQNTQTGILDNLIRDAERSGFPTPHLYAMEVAATHAAYQQIEANLIKLNRHRAKLTKELRDARRDHAEIASSHTGLPEGDLGDEAALQHAFLAFEHEKSEKQQDPANEILITPEIPPDQPAT